MAVPTLDNVPTTISLAESTANWVGDTFVLNSELQIQGNNCVACSLTTNGQNQIGYTGSWNMNASHLRLWLNTTILPNLNTEANDGIEIYVKDTGNNESVWTVGGQDTYGGGWEQFVVDLSSTPDRVVGTAAVVALANEVGFYLNTNSKPRNVPENTWADAWYFGNGYNISGGTSVDPVTWKDVAAVDDISKYGIVTNIDDVNFLAGDLTIGFGANSTWFESNEKVQFRDFAVSATLYNIRFVNSGTTVRLNGGAIGAATGRDYGITTSGPPPDVEITGVQFSSARAIVCEATQSWTNCVFDDCQQVVPLTCIFQNNRFSNSTATDGAMLWGDSSNTKNIQFINCANGVEIATTSTPKSFDNITFDDEVGNFDVNNTSGSPVTVNLTNGSNANSYTGSLVTFASSVLLSLVVKDENGDPVENAFAYIDEDNISPYIMNTQTNASGIASTTWTGGTVAGATWRVRLYGYKPFKVIADIGATNQEIPVTLIVDPQTLINPNPPTGPTEYQTEGDFSNGGAAWILSGPTVVGGELVVSSGTAEQNMGINTKWVKVQFDVTAVALNLSDSFIIKTVNSNFIVLQQSTIAVQSYTCYGLASSDTLTIQFVGSGSCTIDNVRVVEVDVGNQLFVNEGFAVGGVGWSSSGTVVFANDEVTLGQVGAINQTLALTEGNTYVMGCECTAAGGQIPVANLQNTSLPLTTRDLTGITRYLNGVAGAGTTTGFINGPLAGTFTLDNVFLREIIGEI